MANNMVILTLRCGHTVEVAGRFLGRGAARQKRINERQSHVCNECYNNNLWDYARKHLKHLNGTPATAEEQQKYVEKRMRK